MTTTTLHYGRSGRLKLDVPDDRLVASCGLPASPPLADVAQATADALAAPIDYPPLPQLVVPGDKVCVALADGVPQAAARGASGYRSACWPQAFRSHDITLIRGSAGRAAGRGGWPGESLTQAASKSKF